MRSHQKKQLTSHAQTRLGEILPVTRIQLAAVLISVLIWSACGDSARNQPAIRDDTRIGRAFEDRTSDVQVEGEGVVTRILADDLTGSRHQRFIVRLGSGQTILIVHNIDLAPRVSELQTGDRIGFYGEYVWNAEGGMVHWTHHDPQGKHEAGWLKRNGRTYQ
jgi:hypothetical protein